MLHDKGSMPVRFWKKNLGLDDKGPQELFVNPYEVVKIQDIEFIATVLGRSEIEVYTACKRKKGNKALSKRAIKMITAKAVLDLE